MRDHIILNCDLESYAPLGDITALARSKPIRINRRRVGQFEMDHALATQKTGNSVIYRGITGR